MPRNIHLHPGTTARNDEATSIAKAYLKKYGISYGKLYREKRATGYSIKFHGLSGEQIDKAIRTLSRKLKNDLGLQVIPTGMSRDYFGAPARPGLRIVEI